MSQWLRSRWSGACPRSRSTGSWRCPRRSPTVAVLPRFQELVAPYHGEDGNVDFPDGVTARTLLQQATREVLTGMGLDVSGLTDAQMVDNQGWVLFPNFFMTVRAGECHVIMSTPHPDGDPNRCIWHVASYMWLPQEYRDAFSADRSWWTSRAATSTSRRCNRTTSRCRASSRVCATTASTTCRWSRRKSSSRTSTRSSIATWPTRRG